MKVCYNCKGINRENDKYCRNCGMLIKSNSYYILLNVGMLIVILFLVLIIILFIASYYAY